MPVLVVKSFPNSTSALAGSHAAQHRVNCLASAGAWPARHEATIAAAPNARIARIIKTSLLLQAIARLPCNSHFSVHADQSGLHRSRGKRCLVFLLSKSFSLNID